LRKWIDINREDGGDGKYDPSITTNLIWTYYTSVKLDFTICWGSDIRMSFHCWIINISQIWISFSIALNGIRSKFNVISWSIISPRRLKPVDELWFLRERVETISTDRAI
jgi:hypothetical protein